MAEEKRSNISRRSGMPAVTGATSSSNGSVINRGQRTQQAMIRTTDLRGGRNGLAQMAAASVVRTAPKVYSPLYEMSNLMLPRDLRTMNTWNRHFYNCFDEETETLTNKGFKRWNEIIKITEDESLDKNLAEGLIDETIRVAAFNPETEEIELQRPDSCNVFNFDSMKTGIRMIKFSTNKIDVMVTPEHRMFVDKIGSDSIHWQNKWRIQLANEVNKNTTRFRSCAKWKGIEPTKKIIIGEQEIQVEDYLNLLGYYLSEGTIQYFDTEKGKNTSEVRITQNQFRKGVLQEKFVKLKEDLEKLPLKLWYGKDSNGIKNGNSQNGEVGIRVIGVSSPKVAKELISQCGDRSENKRIPEFVKQWDIAHLKILLNALLLGDGTESTSSDYGRLGTNAVKQYIYTTISEELANDVYEIAFKCGYVPTLSEGDSESSHFYFVHFTESKVGHFPVLKSNSKKYKNREIQEVPYQGIVYCFEVPPHSLFITRRNGKITIQGNTHPVVRNAINLHSTYPISKFEITCRDPKIKNFFGEQCDHIDLTGVLLSVSLEFWKLGEVFPYAELDENKGWWDYIFCFTKGMKITKANGIYQNIEEVKVDDKVVTHTGRIEKVTQVFEREIDEEIISFKYIGSNQSIDVTPQHKFYAVKRKVCSCTKQASKGQKALFCLPHERNLCFTKRKLSNGSTAVYTCQKPKDWDFKWIPISELKVGDYVATPVSQKIIENKDFTKELCRLLGYYIAEGSAIYKEEKPSYISFAFSKEERDLIDEVKELVQKLFDRECKEYVKKGNPNTVEVCLHDQKLVDYFVGLGGRYSDKKKLTEEFMFLDPNLQKEFITTLINGDAGVENGCITLKLTSRDIITQVLFMLARLGIEASYAEYGPSGGGKKDVYQITIKPSKALNFRLMESKIKKFKQLVVNRFAKVGHQVRIIKNGYILSPISEKIKKGYKGKVYNFATENDHSYLVQGLAAHNCHNPDYIRVKTNVLTREPIITLIPDDALRRLAMTQNAADRALKEQLPDEVIYHLQRGEDIPLQNFNCSHLKMLSSDYDIRGSSIIMSVYKDLMLYDKIREAKYCLSEDTEVFTDNGFKLYNEVTKEDKIACFNPNTEEIEFHSYIKKYIFDYNSDEDGNLFHFNGKKVDSLVTPDHQMWVQEFGTGNTLKNWGKCRAKEMNRARYRLRAQANWKGEEPPKEVTLYDNVKLDIETYLKFVGYFATEGTSYINDKKMYEVSLYQNKDSDCFVDIERVQKRIAQVVGREVKQYNAVSKSEKVCKRLAIFEKQFTLWVRENLGVKKNKYIPKWIKNLSKPYLEILLSAMIKGDGNERLSVKENTEQIAFGVASKQLANDFYEIAYKCGYVPTMSISIENDAEFYRVYFSKNSLVGHCPIVGTDESYANIDQVPYKGIVFCFEVPHHLFVVRRNGKISITGNSQADNFINPVTLVKLGDPTGAWKPNDQDIINFRNAWMESQYDPDAKLITHGAVTVEKVSNAGQTLDVAQDLELIMKNLYTGLMVPEAIMNGEGPNYATASIGLEVLRARYERFRNLITRWVKKKLFEPISKIQDFYEYKDGEKKLIVPDVQWNKINLREIDSYINALTQMMSDELGKSRVSKRTVFSFLDIDLDTENQNLKEEAIEQLAQQKEIERLSKMSVEELKTVDPTKPITDLHPEEEAALGEGGGPGGGMEGLGGETAPKGLGAALPELGELGGGGEGEAGGEAGGGATPE